jgi:hypothetical protein
MKQCKWCKSFFETSDKPNGWMANHSRWCNQNPKKQDYLDSLKQRDNTELMNAARKKSGNSNQFTKAKMSGKKIKHSMLGKPHPNPFKHHTIQSKKKIQESALKSNHRRLRKGMVEYKGIMLDSSWELALAKRLDELQVKWIRPEPLKWVDTDGNEHNYFPDFYLQEYDLYLDPKNPAAYQNQKEKIIILKKTYKNLKFLLTLNECKKFTIK